MTGYVIRRLLQSIFVLFGVTVIVFLLVQMAGDPVLIALSGTAATEQDLQELRDELGYNDPLLVQYFRYIGQAVRGDLGKSLRFKQPALDLVMERMPATVQLAGAALLFALVIALPVGVLSAVKRHTWIDHGGMLLALLGQSIPLFWLGIMLVLVFAVELRWFPPGGAGSWKHLVLPAITLGAYPMARIARLTRSSLLEVINQEYINTARAKGLREFRVITRHAMRNAALPVVTVVGLMFGTLMGGAVVTETIFAWPGVGLLTIQAIQNRDFPLVQAAVLVVAVAFIFVNLSVDLLYAYLDPRIRYD
jgi:ABC-type dipeptide/oligopeptide/nickel transport system permease component